MLFQEIQLVFLPSQWNIGVRLGPSTNTDSLRTVTMSQSRARIDSADLLYELTAQVPQLEIDTNNVEIARRTMVITLFPQTPSNTTLNSFHESMLSPFSHTQKPIQLESYRLIESIPMETVS